MIILSLGSNLGNRAHNLQQALQLLAVSGLQIVEHSSIYETEPVGFTQQPRFLNMVAVVKTDLPPLALLDICLAVEQQMGRTRTLRWGPRTIDIDIIVYDDVKLDSPRLSLPHPRCMQREFVLIPLREIVPDIPLFQGKTAVQLLSELSEHAAVKIFAGEA